MSTMIGRRLQPGERDGQPAISIGDFQPGDYCGPIMGFTGPKPAVFFLLPNACDNDAPPGARILHHVCSPPHRFRECPDGSLEIRDSISDQPHNSGWHGFLDEGHVWRQV